MRSAEAEPAALGYAALVDISEPEEEPEPDQASLIAELSVIETIKHSGTAIDQVEGGYRIESDFFASLDDAKKAIEDPNLRPLLTQLYPSS